MHKVSCSQHRLITHLGGKAKTFRVCSCWAPSMAFNEMRAIKGSAWMLSGLAWASGKLSIGPVGCCIPPGFKRLGYYRLCVWIKHHFAIQDICVFRDGPIWNTLKLITWMPPLPSIFLLIFLPLTWKYYFGYLFYKRGYVQQGLWRHLWVPISCS